MRISWIFKPFLTLHWKQIHSVDLRQGYNSSIKIVLYRNNQNVIEAPSASQSTAYYCILFTSIKVFWEPPAKLRFHYQSCQQPTLMGDKGELDMGVYRVSLTVSFFYLFALPITRVSHTGNLFILADTFVLFSDPYSLFTCLNITLVQGGQRCVLPGALGKAQHGEAPGSSEGRCKFNTPPQWKTNSETFIYRC